MNFHWKVFVVDVMFAWMMEMELDQLVRGPSDLERAAILEIKLDRVAVVHDRIGLFGPGEFKRRKLRGDRIFDVDRRLLTSSRADLIRGIKIAPMFRTARAFVVPDRVVRREAGSGARSA
jgi:hypothetical protein